MRLSKFILLFLLFITSYSNAQVKNANNKPKLIVGLVIDQMRWDYLYRFENRYGKDGFKRLQSKGYSFENTVIPYVPTVTAAGHTSIYTGGVPATNGIVGNGWYDKAAKKYVYCTDDSTVHGIGNNDAQGKMSPVNNYATTITDELKLSSNKRSKVIGIALKDRASILPAGHMADAAYWYDEVTGKWITSNYYVDTLPRWVQSFNDKDIPSTEMQKDWNTLYPIETYTQSSKDENRYELDFPILKSHVFPYKLSHIKTTKYNDFKLTPYAITYSFDFAKEAIIQENLGNRNETDFLALSISTTDYVGHSFGPNSIEIEDLYLRLDKDIAAFLQFLDNKIGKNNYTIFLTADHGVAHVNNFLKDNKIPSSKINTGSVQSSLGKSLKDSFGVNPILDMENYQIYLDYDLLQQKNISRKSVHDYLIKLLKAKDYVLDAFEYASLNSTTLAEPMKTRFANGYDAKRCGDIQILLKPGSTAYQEKGTGHIVWNPYDSHIPLLFYGWGIKQGSTHRETYMTDIAPTISSLLNIQIPSGNVDKPLLEITR